MYQLVCTSYNETEQGLVLRNSWIEAVINDQFMLELVKKWQLPDDFKYPSKGSISNVLEGRMQLEGVVIHVRMIKF